MCAEHSKIDSMFTRTTHQTDIVQAEFQITKVVATFSGKRSVSEISAEALQGSAPLQSELVDNAITNLPAELMRVSRLQKTQGSNISALKEEFSRLQEQKKKLLAKCAEMREELEKNKRQGILLEQDLSKKNNHCILLKNEILALVKEAESKRRLLSTRTTELQALRSQLSKYQKTVDDYTTSVASSVLVNSKVQAHIASVQERLDMLTEKRDFLRQNPEEAERIRGGAAERELREKVAELTSESDRLQEDIRRMQEKVCSTREEQQQVNQAIVVLKKRNAAQLIRLKRQVKEQHVRHRQWADQSRLLQQNINTLTTRLQAQ